MKKLIAFCALAAVLASCQKEISYEDPNANPPTGGGGGTGGGGSSSNKLVRIGTKSGADSVTRDINYNSSNRIIGYAVSGTSGGQAIDLTVAIERNSSNVITKTVYTSSSFAQYGIPNLTYNVTYDAAASRYKHSVMKLTILGVGTLKDSIVYQYDGSGKLASLLLYSDDGTGYVPYEKRDYTYSGSNVATAKYYTYDDQTNTYDLDATDTYEYDSKTNPLQFAVDAPILGDIDGFATFFSANNVTKITSLDSGGSTDVATTAYTYNGNNRPTVGITTAGSATSTSTYYYQ